MGFPPGDTCTNSGNFYSNLSKSTFSTTSHLVSRFSWEHFLPPLWDPKGPLGRFSHRPPALKKVARNQHVLNFAKIVEIPFFFRCIYLTIYDICIWAYKSPP